MDKLLFAQFIDETPYDSNKIGYNTKDWKVSGGSFNDSYGEIKLTSAEPATARLEIPGLEHKFSTVEARVRFTSGKKQVLGQRFRCRPRIILISTMPMWIPPLIHMMIRTPKF